MWNSCVHRSSDTHSNGNSSIGPKAALLLRLHNTNQRGKLHGKAPLVQWPATHAVDTCWHQNSCWVSSVAVPDTCSTGKAQSTFNRHNMLLV